MHKIFTPQSNSNDEFVFISEWKFKNNDYINKGDHLLSVETSKVVEEIYSEYEGYLEKLYENNSKVKVGDAVALINPKQKVLNSNNLQKNNTIFTEKAKKLIKENSLNEDDFNSKKIVKESDVLNFIDSMKVKLPNKKYDQLIILVKEDLAYHAGIYLDDLGIIDLSLLGSRISKINEYNFANCKCIFFRINMKDKEKMIKFFQEPALLTDKIIKKEKSSKGWAMKTESADFILNFRKKRSKDVNDMNCIEWLIHGMELGGLEIPSEILTAGKLLDWADRNLEKIYKEDNKKSFFDQY
jgi:glycine cleavage system H lipoate-binding protein